VAVCAVNCTVDGRSCSQSTSDRSIARYLLRIAIFAYSTFSRLLRYGDPRRNIAVSLGMEKLRFGYQVKE